MLRSDRQIRTQVHQWMDGGLFALGLWLAHYFRFHWHGIHYGPIHFAPDAITPFVPDYFWLFLALIPMAQLVLEWQGFYKRPVFTPHGLMAWQLAKSCFICTMGLILSLYMFKRQGARGVMVLFGFFSFGLVFLKEELVRWAYKSKLGVSQRGKRVVLIGSVEETGKLRAEILGTQESMQVLAEFDLNETAIEKMVAFFHEHSVNGVIINARHSYFGQVEKAIQACELEGIEVWLVADFFKTHISRTSLDDFYGRPVLVFHSGPQSPWPRLAKQMIDFLGALGLLVAASPFMAIAAALVKLTSPGPVFFRQQRAGLNGKPFVMYKFRSMVTNAEQLKEELAVLNEMSGPVFKVTNDPRVTWIGRILRKFSIDEFPQLFNVLRFEMSLVGPRPLPVDEVRRFDDAAHRRRLSVKPGLTCLWQVGGRNNVTDFKEWVRLDLEYIDHWSLWLDLMILWRTIPVVLLGKGAR